MTETTADLPLWGDPVRPFPPGGEPDVGELERLLPLTDDLRSRILAWARVFLDDEQGLRPLDPSDFDGRGMLLSRELQRELGPAYSVTYFFERADMRSRWMPTVADDPCPGWSAH